MTPPEGFAGEIPTRQEREQTPMPDCRLGLRGDAARRSDEATPEFHMNDKVNAFTGGMVSTDKTA